MNHKRTYLAFDCTSGDSSVALRVGDLCHERVIPAGKQSALLIAMIDELMQEAAIGYDEVSAIVTTSGPGTFTGIRIALAAAHGLHLAVKTPLKVLTTMQAYAWQAGEPCEVVLNAGKGEVYHQSFTFTDRPVAESEIAMIAPQGLVLRHRNVIGNILLDHVAGHVTPIDAKTLCAVAPQLEDTLLADAVPLYIRPPDAKLPQQRHSAT